MSLNVIKEKLGIGFVMRRLCGAYYNMTNPEFNLFKALALKSGLPGTPVFTFTTDGKEVKLVPFGQHLDQHGGEIKDMKSLRVDFEKPEGKIAWITKFRLIRTRFLGKEYLACRLGSPMRK